MRFKSGSSAVLVRFRYCSFDGSCRCFDGSCRCYGGSCRCCGGICSGRLRAYISPYILAITEAAETRSCGSRAHSCVSIIPVIRTAVGWLTALRRPTLVDECVQFRQFTPGFWQFTPGFRQFTPQFRQLRDCGIGVVQMDMREPDLNRT